MHGGRHRKPLCHRRFEGFLRLLFAPKVVEKIEISTKKSGLPTAANSEKPVIPRVLALGELRSTPRRFEAVLLIERQTDRTTTHTINNRIDGIDILYSCIRPLLSSIVGFSRGSTGNDKTIDKP